MILETREAFWSAPVLWRFAPRLWREKTIAYERTRQKGNPPAAAELSHWLCAGFFKQAMA
jgi:hypothetical protein